MGQNYLIGSRLHAEVAEVNRIMTAGVETNVSWSADSDTQVKALSLSLAISAPSPRLSRLARHWPAGRRDLPFGIVGSFADTCNRGLLGQSLIAGACLRQSR